MNQDQNHTDQETQNEHKPTIKRRTPMKRWKFILIIVMTIMITAIVTVVATISLQHKLSGLDKDERHAIHKFTDAYKTVHHDYYKNTNTDKLIDEAIRGMVKSLDDPYSEYMDKDKTKAFNENVSGDFVGIGAEMQKKDGYIMITSPMKKSPAEKAGLKSKDIVTHVDGKSIKNKPLEAVVKMVRGEKGTTVTLTVNRAGDKKDIKIKRDVIHVKSVEYKEQDNIGVIAINKFQSGTAAELKNAVLKAHKNGNKQIVIDLRNNPGGLLDEAIKMANIFIDKGKTVIKLDNGNEKESIQAPIEPLKEAKGMKVSILVNEGSASASEVFTGALKDHNIAKVYGSKTFGKGIVQTTHEYNDGSLLKFTDMKWLTPDGHYVQGKGIKPDVDIKRPAYETLSIIPDKTTLKHGDDNKHVKTIKVGLQALGYNIDQTSTSYDKQLEQAVTAFQKDHHLKTHGQFDKATNQAFTEQLVKLSTQKDNVLSKLIKQLK